MSLDTAKATVTLRSLTHKFDMAAKAADVFYPTISTVVPSNRLNEQYGWLGGMPGVREWLGDRQFKELRASNFVLANRLWEDSLLIQKTDLQDDVMGMYEMVMPQLGLRAAQHPDKLLFQTLTAAETTACFDGQYFFDSDHAFGDSGSQSNLLTCAAASGTTPTVQEFKDAYAAAVSAMLGFKDDQGEPFSQPTVKLQNDILVVVPPQLRQTAYQALILVQPDTVYGVIDNPKLVVSPFLTDATKFYVFKNGDFLKPFIFQAREPLSRQMKGLEDIETKDVKFMTQARYNVGYLAWWNAVLTTFT